MSDIIGKNETVIKIACNHCKNFFKNDKPIASCTAFDNIPKEIISGNNQHTKPLSDQKNNIVFEPAK